MKSITALVPAILILTSCAIIDSHVKLEYNPGSPLVSSEQLPVIALDPPLANLSTKFQGAKKNAYGWHTAKLYAEPSPAEFMMLALRSELAVAGIRTTDRPEAFPRIRLEITRFVAEPEVGFFAADVYATIDASVVLQTSPTRSYARSCRGVGNLTTIAWPDIAYTSSLDRAVHDFMRKCIPSIVQKIQRPGN